MGLAAAIPLRLESPGPPPPFPEDQEALAGWPLHALRDGTRLYPATVPTGPVCLTVAVGANYMTPCTWRYTVGQTTLVWDADYASHAERYHLPLPEPPTPAMPIILSAVDQAPPLWVSLAPGAAPALVPGGPPAAPVAAMLARLERHAITQFGWQNGCVLEAHSALAEHDPARWRQAWERAMAPYLRADGLHFQSARGLPLNNRLTTIESTLPWASLAQFAPTHPANTLGLDFWHAHQSPPGLIADGQTLSAEGCYTVAYPLMAQARLRQDEALAELAVSQLRHRRLALIHDGDLYLRGSPTARTFRNWCRGICWYLLGQTQTLLASGTPAQWPDLLAHLAERASWIASYQRPDGLWSNFLEDPQLPPDCSGSAGIATALLRASQAGLVAQDYRPLAERCWAGLMPYLTSDGWLTGCGPNNKRDEAHQRRPRRSTPVFGLGLAGQLLAALGKDQA